MNTADTYRLSTSAAEGYERQKVPSLFGPMARATLDAVSLPDGAHIVDVACGTGIIAKVAAARLGGTGRIVGTDLNPGMIEVARRTMPASCHRIEWFACDVTDSRGCSSFPTSLRRSPKLDGCSHPAGGCI